MKSLQRSAPDDHEPFDRGFVTGGRLLLLYCAIVVAALIGMAV